MSCRFCEIAKERPGWATLVSDEVIMFKPFGASNPECRLFVPIEHVADAAEDPFLTGRVVAEAAWYGKEKGWPFKIKINSGAEAGQHVFHLHAHYVPFAINT